MTECGRCQVGSCRILELEGIVRSFGLISSFHILTQRVTAGDHPAGQGPEVSGTFTAP